MTVSAAGEICPSCEYGILTQHLGCLDPGCPDVRCPRCCRTYYPRTRMVYDVDWRPEAWPRTWPEPEPT